MNPGLNKQLYGLLTLTGLKPQKATLVNAYTAGRSESSIDLTNEEAKELIKELTIIANKNGEACQKMRRKMLSMAHEMHWHETGTQKIDMVRINNWCKVYGFGKKVLNAYTYTELPKLVSVFTIVYKDYLSNL